MHIWSCQGEGLTGGFLTGFNFYSIASDLESRNSPEDCGRQVLLLCFILIIKPIHPPLRNIPYLVLHKHILVFKFLVKRPVSLVLIKFHLALWQDRALPNVFSSLKIADYICPQLNQCKCGLTALTSIKLHWYGQDQNLTQQLETNLTWCFKMLSVLQFLRLFFFLLT